MAFKAQTWVGSAIAAFAWAAAAGSVTPARAAPAADECKPAGGLNFLCGIKKPEDLAVLPGGRWLIATGMTAGGGLHLVDARTKTWSRWFATAPATPSRIYKDCAAPPKPDDFIAHGLSLRTTGAGRSRLYVVNHGGRETIEVFDVDARGAKPALSWVGCVAMPKDLAANSVAGGPDGSLLATVLTFPGTTIADAFAGKNTGAVFEWRPGWTGFRRLAGTDLPTANGIERSADDKTFYVVSSAGGQVVAFSHTDPARILGKAEMGGFSPDNVHWYGPGRLVAAGMRDEEPACGGRPKATNGLSDLAGCARGYMADLIDPATMKATPLVSGPRTPAHTGATIVQKAGGALWIGSFVSDRLAYRPAP